MAHQMKKQSSLFKKHSGSLPNKTGVHIGASNDRLAPPPFLYFISSHRLPF